MPAIFVAIFTFLSSALGPLVAKVLTSIGVGIVTYTGITLLLDQVKGQVIASIANGAYYANLFGLAKVDVAVNIMLAAVAARAALSGLDKASGSISKVGSVGKGS